MSNAILLAALVAGVDPDLLSAICFVESGHNPKAYVHNDGGSPSYGQCQIKMGTAKDMGFRGTKKELMSESVNALYSAKYLQYQRKRYGSWEKAIIAYNAGRVTYKTTYVNKVKQVMGRVKWTALQNARVGKNQQKNPSQLLSITTALHAKKKLTQSQQKR